MSSSRVLIRGGRLVTSDRLIDGDLLIEDGVISQVGGAAEAAASDEIVDANGLYVLPGFVDLHVHGGCGFSVTAGLFDPERRRFDARVERYRERLPQLAAHFARHGVTYALATTWGDRIDRLKRALGLLAEYALGERNGLDGCRLGGAFLEGTFIKDARFAGAQNPENFREPSAALFDEINDAARGIVRYVNVTPEFGDSALSLIEELDGRGTLVGAGHSGCTAEEFHCAVEHGLRIAIHLTNGPTGNSFKTFNGGGMLEGVLTSPVFAELIVDGYHVNPAYVLDIVRRKGADKICVISDAMFAAGAEGIEEFEIGGTRGALSADGKYVGVVGKPNTLFSSVLTMDVGFANVLNWLTAGGEGVWNAEHPPLAFEAALLTASRFASANPAKALRLYEPESAVAALERQDCIGSLEIGKRADVTMLKIEGEPGAYGVDVKSVLVAGRPV